MAVVIVVAGLASAAYIARRVVTWRRWREVTWRRWREVTWRRWRGVTWRRKSTQELNKVPHDDECYPGQPQIQYCDQYNNKIFPLTKIQIAR